jgi:diguanylate cyclase (GGDEF)-like protein
MIGDRNIRSSQLILKLIVASAVLSICLALQVTLLSLQAQQYLVPFAAITLLEIAALVFGATIVLNIVSAIKAASNTLSRLAPPDPTGDRGDAIDTLLFATARAADKVRSASEELERLQEVDPLTGLGNRRWLRMRAMHELDRARREQSPISLILVKVDRLADIKTKLGHDAGDQALLSAGDVLREVVRPYDLVARITDDEFGVLLPGADLSAATDITTRMRTALENRKLSLLGDLGLSAAFAVIERQVEDTWFDRFLARAYQRLAASPTAKSEARDRLFPPAPEHESDQHRE